MTGNRSTQQFPNLIVGREREQQQVRSALVRSLDGIVSLALVSGEAGIGKSTLVDELRRTAGGEGCLVLAGGCYELETTPPYGPWVEIVRAYPDDVELPDLPDELRPGGGMEGVDSQPALFDLASRFFAEIASRRPLILILEDVHWADPASLDLLRYLARSRSQSPLLIVATYRDEEISEQDHLFSLLPALVRESQATRIELQRLSVEDVTDLVAGRYRLASDSQDRLVDYLCRLAEGNPFFITELLHTLEEHGTLTPTAGGWRLGDLDATGVPVLVQQVIARRMASLDRPARIVLDIAAVAGADATLDLLESLQAGVDADLDTMLQQAIDHRLLVLYPDGRRIRFSHALVRQAVYESIPPLRRRSLHRQIGELLASRARPDPDRAAHHFYQAGDERALIWLARAAEQAQSLFAPETVIIRCRQAIDLANQLEAEPPLAIYRLQGLALETVGDFDGALESHEAALERSRLQDERESEWQALLDLASLWASRDYDRTGDYCQQAVELARTMNDPAVLGHSLNRLGNWELNAGDPTSSIPKHEEALEIFSDLDDRRGMARTLDLMAISYALTGRPLKHLESMESAVTLLREIQDKQTLATVLTTAASSLGTSEAISRIYLQSPSLGLEAYPALAESLKIAREIGSRPGESFAMWILGELHMLRGQYRLANDLYDAAADIAEGIGHQQWLVIGLTRRGRLSRNLLDLDQALDQFEQALDLARRIRSRHWQAESATFLASILIARGDYGGAKRVLDQTIGRPATPQIWGEWYCCFVRVELQLAQDQPDLALESLDGIIERMEPGPGYVTPFVTRMRGECLMAVGRMADAEKEFRAAHQVARLFRYRPLEWRTLASLCRLLIVQGRLDEAESARLEATAIVGDLAEDLWDASLRDSFRARALALIPGRPPFVSDRSANSGFAGLTSREFEVLGLVALGLTNEEVSERLFISPRTVGQHLRSIYNKLGVSNRTAASRIATEEGLL